VSGGGRRQPISEEPVSRAVVAPLRNRAHSIASTEIRLAIPVDPDGETAPFSCYGGSRNTNARAPLPRHPLRGKTFSRQIDVEQSAVSARPPLKKPERPLPIDRPDDSGALVAQETFQLESDKRLVFYTMTWRSGSRSY